MAKSHRYLSQTEAKQLGLPPKENQINRKQARYYLTPEEWEAVVINRQTPNKREFIEVQRKFDKDGEITSSLEKFQSKPIEIPANFEIIKVSTSKTTGQQWVQYAAKKEDVEIKEFDFDAIIKKHIKPIKTEKVKLFNVPLLNISATFIRDSIQKGKDVRYWLTEPVHDYIAAHHLYQ